jgi:hypothetical protein
VGQVGINFAAKSQKHGEKLLYAPVFTQALRFLTSCGKISFVMYWSGYFSFLRVHEYSRLFPHSGI